MAGVKGRSGGKRPGAGRKPAPKAPPKAPVQSDGTDMLEFLQDVARGLTDATPLQVRAAIAAVQYTHTKMGDGGKKEAAAEAAKKAAQGGRFAVASAPKLIVDNR